MYHPTQYPTPLLYHTYAYIQILPLSFLSIYHAAPRHEQTLLQTTKSQLLLLSAMAAAEECVEPLKYQTWILKVSIHCQGCKKKVKKVLQTMEGVYKTTVDSQQHKVVVTGNVEAEMLIKRLLIKAGKQAELWQEKKPPFAAQVKAADVHKKNKNSNDKMHDESPTQTGTSIESKRVDFPVSQNAAGGGKAAKNGRKDSPPPPGDDRQGVKKAAEASSGVGGGKKKAKKTEKDNGDHDGNNRGGGGKTKSKSGGRAEVTAAQEEYDEKEVSNNVGGTASLLPPEASDYPLQMPSYVVSYSLMQPSVSFGGAVHQEFPVLQNGYMYSPPAPVPVASVAGSYCYYSGDDYSGICSIM
ncbi:heavy metal-associated isoprenylated plant protein 36-like [Zingiber officinale]|uniref:heavy metal-associated isoprenylated plant protein 36-like n=1 Tax=Zingiber officinale TaxID=94328 RepID=UPI001C4A9147|nr:heavy metal-associated isoprenylated plant protein 36-like [Zingiber officinale]